MQLPKQNRAIGLEEYTQRANFKIAKLLAEMAIIDKSSDRWQKLRKQMLAYKERVEQRKQDRNAQQSLKRR